MESTFAVFGLGRFGGSLVKELAAMNQEILAVDLDPEKVDYYSTMQRMPSWLAAMTKRPFAHLAYGTLTMLLYHLEKTFNQVY